jgi:hypothetical protein
MMMHSQQSIPIPWQGSIARSLLAGPQRGSILGLTSRGIFIRLPSSWVLFISQERYRGPLTLNLPAAQSIPTGLETGQSVTIDSSAIQFPGAGIDLDIRRAATWEAPPLPSDWLAAPQRRVALESVVQLAQSREPGLRQLSGSLLAIEPGAPLPAEFAWVDGLPLLNGLRNPSPNPVVAALTPFFGRGPGLTPSGDDLLQGLLLAFARWGAVLRPIFPLAEVSARLNSQAVYHTSLLSANLIACAAQGQADERLVAALDGIMTGDPGPEACAQLLLGWGSSSGGDALAGMTLAILSAST